MRARDMRKEKMKASSPQSIVYSPFLDNVRICGLKSEDYGRYFLPTLVILFKGE